MRRFLRSDVECGTLHCQGGFNAPVVPSQSVYSSHSRKVNGEEFQCKVTSRNGNGGEGEQDETGVGGGGGLLGGLGSLGGLGMEQDPYANIEDLGMVQDGTKCGEEMVRQLKYNVQLGKYIILNRDFRSA